MEHHPVERQRQRRQLVVVVAAAGIDSIAAAGLVVER